MKSWHCCHVPHVIIISLQYNATPEEQCFPSPARTYFTQMESARYVLSIPSILLF
jgi:hypothetical protein